jgi:hypothetical protein
MGASKENLLSLIVSSATRSLARMFPALAITSTKHNHWYDFGFPDSITFEQAFTMYKRNGIARAGIVRPVEKCWQDNPWILEHEKQHKETTLEAELRKSFDQLQFWQRLKKADEYSRVGKYAGVVFRFADGKQHREPVERVTGGLNALVEVIPVFETQLTVAEWDRDEKSATYGRPKMYRFNEGSTAIGGNARSFDVHPDRVHIWSEDSTVHGESALDAGYNDLLTIEKVIGAGGEGFWKNARSPLMLNVDKDANVDNLARMLGVPVEKISEAMDEVVEDFDKGFDRKLMTQGIEAKNLAITLPDPEKFVLVALQSFAASIPIPLKILIGSQTGERASTEDHKEFAQTCQTRRTQLVVPNIRRILAKLAALKVIPERDYFVSITDLTEASKDEKIARAEKMSTINKNMMGTGERAFTADEIREAVGMESGEELGLDLDDDLDDDTKGDAQ